MGDVDTSSNAYKIGYSIGILIGVAILYAVIMAFIICNMFIFHKWLDYDYVTVSSVLYAFLVGFYWFTALLTLFKSSNELSDYIGIAFALLIFPFSLISGLSIYEGWMHPVMSNELDIPKLYAHIVGVPFALLADLIGKLVPAAGKAITDFMSNTFLSAITINVISGLLTAMLARNLFPKHATA